MPRVQIEEVLSFYTQFKREPTDRCHLRSAATSRARMRGAERLLDAPRRKLGIEPGETTPDGRFTLSTVECLGSCGTAPVMMVNEAYDENVSTESLDALIERPWH